MLWEVDIYPAPGQPDRPGAALRAAATELGVAGSLQVAAAHGFLIQGPIDPKHIRQIAHELLVDSVVEQAVIGPAGHVSLTDAATAGLGGGQPWQVVHVLPKPGVMDPVAQSAIAAIADFDLTVDAVRTLRKYWFAGVSTDDLKLLCTKLLANDAIEQAIVGPLPFDRLELGSSYEFKRVVVPLRSLDDAALERLSREGQLYLSLVEMQTIQAHFRSLDRDPTDVELETVAQTWSEHCSHKTLAGRIAYRGPEGERTFRNMLKETIFAATNEIREALGRATGV